MIAAAGVWVGLLIVVRLFDRPLGQNLLALACAALLAVAGASERAKRPPDDLPDEPRPRRPRRPRDPNGRPGPAVAAADDDPDTTVEQRRRSESPTQARPGHRTRRRAPAPGMPATPLRTAVERAARAAGVRGLAAAAPRHGPRAAARARSSGPRSRRGGRGRGERAQDCRWNDEAQTRRLPPDQDGLSDRWARPAAERGTRRRGDELDAGGERRSPPPSRGSTTSAPPTAVADREGADLEPGRGREHLAVQPLRHALLAHRELPRQHRAVDHRRERHQRQHRPAASRRAARAASARRSAT